MRELSGRELLGEWRKTMEAVLAAAASPPARAELARELLHASQRQIELVQEVIERERAIQGGLAGRLFAPLDAVFDLLEETGVSLRRQAETLEAAGAALEETAGLMRRQAELFERTIGALRQPAELAKSAAGATRGRGAKRATEPKRATGGKRAAGAKQA
ncbi:MAG TPA: hypothetical protein VF706_04540, partial [Solirubrobacteraceae bacterium]